MSPSELKQLKSRLADAEAKLQTAVLQQKEANREVDRLSKAAAALRQSIQQATSNGLVISEHAYLRYLERVGTVDLKKLEPIIVPEKVRQQIQALGNGEFPCGTHSVRVKNNVVVSVITHDNGH